MEALAAPQTLGKGFFILSLKLAFAASILHQFVEIGIFIEFLNTIILAVETQAFLLKGIFVIKAILMIIILAERTLQHMAIAAPTLAFPADPYLLLGCSHC